MGTGNNDNGRIIVTDGDCISMSNLSRQFLYRESDIGSSKSRTAAKELEKYRCSNIIPYEIFVTQEK
jgi:ubiquitin-activating enzyme E1